ncbi:MAG: radical SAM protein [Patescibacteria group bacterium]|nr:radical SAM protein [Patescibacteria group bacterium]
MMKPKYLSLSKKDWKHKIERGQELLAPCQICPWECGVSRTDKNAPTGICGMREAPVISSAHPHFGEEKCLVGHNGSGTIFFTSCNLSCVYCQNFRISQQRMGQVITIQELAQTMLKLQKQGCHNINLVSPSIWVPQILKALSLAKKDGLNLPLVYNTGGYDRPETLKLLEGVIAIYMPDIKYSENKMGEKYSGVPDYWDTARKAIKEMHHQAGDLKINDEGIAKKGLLVRHLILPNNIAGTKQVMNFLAKKISKNTYVNIMDQYRPTHNASNYPKLSRTITKEEFKNAVQKAREVGLWRFDHLT